MNKENWKVGNHNSCVVSDTKVRNTNFPTPPNREESADDEIEYYGGYLICESVGNNEHAELIAAAPDLLHALEAILPHAELIINANHQDYKNALAAIKKAKGDFKNTDRVPSSL